MLVNLGVIEVAALVRVSVISECFVMLENVLLKLNSVVEHFRLKGMIFVLMKIMSWFKIHNFLQF